MAEPVIAPSATPSGLMRLWKGHRALLGVALVAGFGGPMGLGAMEVRLRERSTALSAARTSVTDAPLGAPDAAKDGTLVHVSGAATAEEPLRDEVFGLAVPALRLLRTVEMYQWQEQKETLDPGINSQGSAQGSKQTVVTYIKRWSPSALSTPIFRERDGQRNPGILPYEDRVVSALHLKVGAYGLAIDAASQLNHFEPYPFTEEMLARLPEDLRGKGKVSQGALFLGAKPEAPEVGDVRISFQIVKAQDISVVGRQNGALVIAAEDAQMPRVLVAEGNVETAALFSRAEPKPGPLGWATRGLVFVLLALVGSRLVRRVAPNFAVGPVGPRSAALVIGVLGALVLAGATAGGIWITTSFAIAAPFLAAAVVGVVGLAVLIARARSAPRRIG